MQDEEKEYQKFIIKTLNASREFVVDYNNLSQKNKLRFQQDLELKLGIDLTKSLIMFLQNKY